MEIEFFNQRSIKGEPLPGSLVVKGVEAVQVTYSNLMRITFQSSHDAKMFLIDHPYGEIWSPYTVGVIRASKCSIDDCYIVADKFWADWRME